MQGILASFTGTHSTNADRQHHSYSLCQPVKGEQNHLHSVKKLKDYGIIELQTLSHQQLCIIFDLGHFGMSSLQVTLMTVSGL